MTHFTLGAFRTDLDSALHKSSAMEDCTFCSIVAGKLPAHKLYEDEHTVAFLDILPLRKGHTLVIPKQHFETISDITPIRAASLAHTVTRMTRAISKAFEDPRLQVITNQVYAQVVHHVHYHIVPAPAPQASSSESKDKKPASALSKTWQSIGHGRTELEDDDAAKLVVQIRKAIDGDVEYEVSVKDARCRL